MGASLCSVFQGLRGNGNQGKAKARPLVGGNGEVALVLWKFGGGLLWYGRSSVQGGGNGAFSPKQLWGWLH